MTIAEAKRELYNGLKGVRAVKGAGIRGSGSAEYIVIFVTEPVGSLGVHIPRSYKGNKVVTEVVSPPRAV